jgi:hypothetical protein
MAPVVSRAATTSFYQLFLRWSLFEQLVVLRRSISATAG